MCGIAGRANVFTGRPVDGAIVESMTACLAHRGPDGAGLHVGDGVALGHRRLAIIDLTPGGHQPMGTADGRYWITFNGEIYNFLELRRRLEQRGRRFVSASDTEVLLQSYEEFGPECVTYLRGMFAFAIWDAVDRRLFMARDRLGKKPLFYRTDGDGIAFASESKAFFAEPGFQASVSPAAIFHYTALLYTPAPWSAFAGVHVLPPAHTLVADASGVRVQRYWRLRYEPKRRWRDEEAIEAIEASLTEAVRLRLISDVPVGAFLSGGLDSSTVVGLMTRVGGQRGHVRTYTIGFEEEDFSELERARAIAAHLGTEHQELVVRPDVVHDLPRIAWHYGEPFADSSGVPTYYLSKMTRAHVTVALNGDGGDEAFAGYECYAAGLKRDWYDALPSGWRRGLAAVASAVLADGNWHGTRARLLGRLQRRGSSPEERYAASRLHATAELQAALFTPEFLAAVDSPHTATLLSRRFGESDAIAWLDRMLSVDVETYLPDMLLAKVDVATMAVGLEGRSPLLDHGVMELAATLPPDLKIRGGVRKYVLRQVAARLLPGALLEGPKRGFSVPIVHWLRGQLRPFVEELLLDGTCARRGVIRQDTVARLLEDHWGGRADRHELIWGLLMLELWWRQFIDRRPSLD